MGAGVPKDTEQAAAVFERAVQSSPVNASYRNWLGSVYFDLGRWREADAQFRAIVANGGRAEDAWNYYWGMTLVKLERPAEASEAFRRPAPPGHNRGADYSAEGRAQVERLSRYQTNLRRGLGAQSTGHLKEARAAVSEAMEFLDTREARERLAAVDSALEAEQARGKLVIALGTVLALALGFGIRFARRNQQPVSLPADLAGSTLTGRFELRHLLGEGGMGQVYEAYDFAKEDKVALKRMRRELKDLPDARERFLKEAHAMARLRHPNIVGLRKIVEFGGDIFLVLDFIDGEPLSNILSERGRLGLVECKKLLSQVCRAVEFAHRNNVVHRDLKPSNIMADASGRAMVMDFGLAREMKDALSRVTSTAAAGTPVYMAPEQHHGKVCRQSDVFALGVTLYEMATGELPFSGPDFVAQKERGTYRKAAALVESLPSGLDALLDLTLAPEPGKRPKSPAEFSDMLDRISEA